MKDLKLTKIALFKGKNIRKTIYNNEWWFSIVDIVAVLTDSLDPNDYWYKMKIRVKNEDGIQLSTICRQLKLPSTDNKSYKTDCVNTEDAFRIVQSIPSPKAEPFKRWLAKVGYERIKEIEDPELGTKRTRMLYKLYRLSTYFLFCVIPSEERDPPQQFTKTHNHKPNTSPFSALY